MQHVEDKVVSRIYGKSIRGRKSIGALAGKDSLRLEPSGAYADNKEAPRATESK